jgi:hypothetical protein
MWLFDVVNDPFEQHDLAAEKPEVVADLLAALHKYNDTNIPQSQSATDPRSNPALFGHVWTPWRGSSVRLLCDPNVTELVAKFDMEAAII